MKLIQSRPNLGAISDDFYAVGRTLYCGSGSIELEERITSLCSSTGSQTILVGSGCLVHIVSVVDLKILYTLPCSSQVRDVQSGGDTLVSLTSQVTVWKLSGGVICKEKDLAGSKVCLSPDGTLVAVMSDTLRVWYRRTRWKSTVGFDYVDLPHYRLIESMEWRQLPGEMNVLSTLDDERVCRLWAETPLPGSFMAMVLVAVIDPFQYVYPNLTLNSTPQSPKLEEMGRVHWLNGIHFDPKPVTVETEKEMAVKSVHQSMGELQTLHATVSEYPDMLFSVDQSGSLMIWGIHNLARRNEFMPKAMILLKTEQTTAEQDFEFFQGIVKSRATNNPLGIPLR